MRKLNITDFFSLGQGCEALRRETADLKDEFPQMQVRWKLYLTRRRFEVILAEPCALLSSSARAAERVIKSISHVVPEDATELFALDGKTKLNKWQVDSIVAEVSSFETILNNDMPEMSIFAVGQIGLMRTDDLIDKAYLQVSEPHRILLTDKAKSDIIAAGKCLAFKLSTASAFHACRAIESGIDQYYEALSGKPYAVSASGGNNNWGAKTEALVKADADEKVTEFLTHIRKQYRNPVTHPEIMIDEHEAVNLFIAALSGISMMLAACKALLDANSTPLLTGLVPTDEASYSINNSV